MKRIIPFLIFFLSSSALAAPSERDTLCVVYFTRIGCPHCAVTDPVVLGEMPLARYGSFAVIEYELSETPVNSQVFRRYLEKTGSAQAVPQIFYGGGEAVVGDSKVLSSLKGVRAGDGLCFLPDGARSFTELDFSALPGMPKIWFKDRVLIRENGSDRSRDALVRALLFSEDPALYGGALTAATPVPAPLSGSEVAFSHALTGGGWLFEWGGATASSPRDRVSYTSASSYLLTHMGAYAKILLALVVAVYLCVLLKELLAKRGSGRA